MHARVRAPRRGMLVALASAALAAGCQTPNATTQPALPRDNSAELVRAIADQPYVTAEAAYRATYALATGESYDGEFDGLAAELRERDLIGDWDHGATSYVRRGDVGYMVCRACNINTGLNWNLTGLGRYAWRELIYHGIAPPSSELGLISGGDFVNVLLKAGEYAERREGGEPRDLPRPG